METDEPLDDWIGLALRYFAATGQKTNAKALEAMAGADPTVDTAPYSAGMFKGIEIGINVGRWKPPPTWHEKAVARWNTKPRPTLSALAREHGVSRQRVVQVLREHDEDTGAGRAERRAARRESR